MIKRGRATRLAQSLYNFAKQMDLMEAEGVSRDSEKIGRVMTRYTFWFAQGPRNFRTTDEIRSLAKRIVRSVK